MASQLSLLGRLQLCCRIAFVVLPSGLFNIVQAAARAWWQRLPLGSSLWNGFARSLMSHISPHQLQAILPSTIETYRTWCTEAGHPHVVDVLADGATRLFWLSKGGEKVVLFFHGMYGLYIPGPCPVVWEGLTRLMVSRRWLCDAAFPWTFGLDGVRPEGGSKRWVGFKRVCTGIW